MNFECLLLSAKAGNEDAITTILQMYRPLLLKYAEYSARDCAPQPLKLSIHSGGIEHPCRCR